MKGALLWKLFYKSDMGIANHFIYLYMPQMKELFFLSEGGPFYTEFA
jgi:hypothetical protein